MAKFQSLETGSSERRTVKETYIRVPEDLHKRLRHEAAEYDTSLNQCIITLLGEALAARHTSAPSP